MHNSEWSLVLFTLFSQTAAGIMIAVLPFVFTKNQHVRNRLNKTALYLATGLMTAALVLSFFHLNNPANAVYALSNLKTSWLSREIFMVSLFLFTLVIIALMLHFRKPAIKHYRALSLLAAAVGAGMIYVMAKLYIIPTVPPWNSISTLVEFYSSALLLGPALVLALFFHYEVKTANKLLIDSRISILIALTVAVLILMTANALFIKPDSISEHAAFKPKPFDEVLLLFRWFSLLLGAVSLSFTVYSKKQLQKMSFMVYLPFMFFLISEIIARAAFYAAFYQVGL
jgi:anaerobic dimethyl sulfoxide reductase subunit C (anchor subunit)